MINKTIDITVTSVHQTTAGKMILAARRTHRGGPAGASPVADPGPRAVAEVPAVDRSPRSVVPDPTHS